MSASDAPASPGPKKTSAGADSEKRSIHEVLREILDRLELFTDHSGDAYATLRVAAHRETYAVRSRSFRRWLAQAVYIETDRAASAEALQQAITLAEARAQFSGGRHPVSLRVAPDGDGGVYIDLGDDAWRAVHVSADGWRITTSPPVRFRRAAGTGPLPIPEPGGDLSELRQYVNIGDDDSWSLYVAWLVGSLAPAGPYAVLVLTGEQGAAKSTAAKVTRRSIDPATPELRSDPKEIRDLMIAARNSWTVALDNVSAIQPWLSDALCRLATGGGWATRELYTDADETIFEAMRPAILTGITNFVTRPDLLDRAIVLRLPTISDDQRRDEASLWARFEDARPWLFGALLDRLSVALRELPGVSLDRMPRMADFARLAVAAERGAGEAPRFMAAYGRLRAQSSEDVVSGSLIGAALLSFMSSEVNPRDRWEGTATLLLSNLSGLMTDRTRSSRAWPQTPRGLSAELRRLVPALRAIGIDVELDRRVGRERTRTILVERAQKVRAEPSAPSTPSALGGSLF